MSVRAGIESFRRGDFVMLFDSEKRENETDLVIPAQYCTPEKIAFMRMNGGGLICAAMGSREASTLGLPFMHDLLQSASLKYPSLLNVIEREAPYGGRSSFSISVNHRDAFTGITDSDRSLTVTSLGNLLSSVRDEVEARDLFARTFRTPGHVPLLIEAAGGLQERRGHTELSLSMARLASLPPATVVCEMLDGSSHRAISREQAERLGAHFSIPLVDGSLL